MNIKMMVAPFNGLLSETRVTVDEADASIALFRAQSQCATQNLIELAEWPIYKCLHGETGETPLDFSKRNRERIQAALAAVDRLWERVALLNDTLDRAKKIRESIWLIDTDAKLKDLEDILHGATLQLASSPTPLQHRTLISAAQTIRMVTIQDMIAELIHDFDEAKTVFVEIDAAIHEGASAAADFEKELAETTRGNAPFFSEPLRRDLDAISASAAALNKDRNRDPLSFHEQVKALRAELEKIKAVAAIIARERSTVSADLNHVAGLARELHDLNAQSIRAAAECRRMIESSGEIPQPLDARVLEDIQHWLDKLNAQFSADFTPLKVALPKFRSRVEDFLRIERRALASNEEALNRWTELHGRLQALRAKARALAARGVVTDPDAEKFAADAEAVLNHRPSSLEKAVKCLHDYEGSLMRSMQANVKR